MALLMKAKSGDFGWGDRPVSVPSLNRKRILARSASLMEHPCSFHSDFSYKAMFQMKKFCAKGVDPFQSSALESLPQEILVKIISGVNYQDLNHLFQVSRAVCQAAKIAEEWHFAYATPPKHAFFRNPSLEEENAPNAPLRNPQRRRLDKGKKKDLADISVALFASDSEDEDA